MPQLSEPEREEPSAAPDVQDSLRCRTYEPREQSVPGGTLLLTDEALTGALVERGSALIPVMPDDLRVVIIARHVDQVPCVGSNEPYISTPMPVLFEP
jgi:hypothetical protein